MTSVQDIVVPTGFGGVRGRRRDRAVVFYGVPYAAAPVGPLRFAPPAPPSPWAEVRDCVQPGPGAPQPPSRLERVVGPMRFPQSEDCLSVNVWTPGVRGRRPVLVWLHGGGYSNGSASQDWYAGAHLATRGDIVVVTVNYRLGALGFLSLAGLTNNHGGDLGAGNFGLLDQIAASRWVRDHIAEFGGDPNQVTLAGQSAGALSTLAMMSTMDSAGLFQRVILQSTPSGVAPATLARATEVAERYLRALDLRPAQAHHLRALPVERLLAAQSEVARQLARPLRLEPPFHLVASPDLVPDDVVTAARKAGAVPRLISVTRDEAAAFLVPDEHLARLSHDEAAGLVEKALGEPAREHYRAARHAALRATPARILTDLMSEQVFHRRIPDLAAGADSYVCQVDWHPDGNPLGACHCIELPFVFDTLPAWHAAPMLAGSSPRHGTSLAGALQPAWIAFTRTGDPNHDGLPHWPRYQVDNSVLHVDQHPSIRAFEP
jgi:para-nitrobenzyl esterase